MAVHTTVEVTMPQMGDSVTEGTILEWHKQEGDQVSEDEILVEVSTDKVDAEVPSPLTGTVVKVHVAEGDTIGVGTVLAEIAPGENGSAPTPTDEAPAAEPDAGGETGGETIDVQMPAMGESVSEGTILEWAKQAGDSVEEDETLVEISTDKVDAEVPAPATGTIAEILADAGDTVTVGQVIARLTTSNGASAKAPEPTSAPRPQASAPPAPTPDGVKITPVAARVGRRARRRPREPEGQRPGRPHLQGRRAGRRDQRRERAAPAAAAEAKPLKGASAMLARYMDESRSVPTATSFRTLTVTALDGRRKELKAAGQRVSFTHLIAYAIARAGTEQMPAMARTFEEIDGKPHVLDAGAVNLGIAVDVERKDGGRTLMVPVIRDAGRLSFPDFLAAFNDLIAKARENKLTADDLQGANVSLTNPGGIGTIASVPRLMKGQGTIVATGAIGYPPGLAAIGATIGAEKVMTMTSTYDHRIIQGAESGQFLQVVEAYLQGEHGFYEQVFRDLGVELGDAIAEAAAAAPAPAAAPAAAPEAAIPDEQLLQAVQAATSLIKAHRTHGHLAARLDPLGSEPEGDPALDPEPLGLTEDIMRRIPAKILRTYVPGATLADALPHLRDTYCGTIAYEVEHIASHRQRMWLREKIESGAFRAPLSPEEKTRLLRRLTQVDSLERFMHKAYLGQKQFSIEGLDMTVPMLDEMIQLAAANGAREVVLGMAHRGRLNVLAHNLGRAYETIFREFEGASSIEAVTTIPQGGTGDVKYHHGAQGTYALEEDRSIIVRLESNPSHLEYVSPIVEGATRAVQTSRQGPHAHLDTDKAIPIILHGDAALPGPGRRGRDVQPAGARRLHGRRLAAHHPEQPGRLHDRPGRLALDPLGLGPRQGLRRPDHPRQRRRRRGLRLRRPAGLRLPPGVRPRRDDRPDRLPPLRPQRGRRAGLHAARDGGQDQAEDAGARAVRGAPRRAGRAHPGGGRRDRLGDLGRAGQAPPLAQGGADGGRRRAADRRLRARPLALAGRQDRRPRRDAAQAQRRAAARPRRLHGPPEADQAARPPPRRRSAPTAASTGRRPSRSPSRRC